MRPIPVELARFQHHGAGLQLAGLDPIDRHHLRVVAGREDLVCVHEVGNLQRRFLDRNACSAQQLERAPARDAGQECTVQRRGLDHAVLDHEQVRGARLCHVAEQVEHEGVVEAARTSASITQRALLG